MSRDLTPPLRPSMYREPLPVWSTALSIKLVDLVAGPAGPTAYGAGDRARMVKLQNVGWFALLSAGVFGACLLLTSSAYTSAVAALLVNVRVPMMPSGTEALSLDGLLSEPIAAAFLVIGSAFLARAVSSGRIRDASAAGMALGLLALTKAIGLYVAGGMAVALACLVLLTPRVEHNFRWPQLAAFTLAVALVAGPWMYRNYRLFHTVNIAERGGVVLAIRAVTNEMTVDEFRGAFYVWAPGRHLRAAVGAALGYTEADLQRGGRLQRLNRSASADFAARDLAAERAGDPDAAVSFYRRARAMRVRLERELTAHGVADASVQADQLLRDQALAMIAGSPWRHLLTTIPLLWRGGLIPFLVLGMCLTYAVLARRVELAVFVLPSLGMIACYSLMTHFIPRYSVPTVPVVIVGGCVLASSIRVGRRGPFTAGEPAGRIAVGCGPQA